MTLDPDTLRVESWEPVAPHAPAPVRYETDAEGLSICLRSCDTACEPAR